MTTGNEKVWTILVCTICANVKMKCWWSKTKIVVTALCYSKVLQGRGTSVFKFQNVNCVSTQSKRLVSISAEFQILWQYGFIKTNYWSVENENGDSILLFSVFITGIFCGVENVTSFQKDLILISAKLSLLWLCRFITVHY